MIPGKNITPTLKTVRKIGQGAMGEVWLAEHTTLGSSVAIKFMDPTIAADPRDSARFRQEAQAAARIDSLHVTRVYDVGVMENGEPYIVMELLKGETLRDRMKRIGPMPLTDVAWIVGQTAKGLAAAHKLGIWHRDIKPDNLFVLDHDGEPFLKIMDFGIAKQSEQAFDSTSTGKGMGSPAYMSPQQFVDSKRVDHRADLWSLGVVAYEALTGRKPFHGLDMFTLAIAIAKGVFKMPSAHRAEIPKAVDDWMRRALNVEVDQRFSSAKEMADAFILAIQQPPEVKSKSYAPPSSSPREAPAGTVFAPKVQDKPVRRRGDLAKELERERDVEPERPSKPPIFTPREEPQIEVTEYPTRGYASITGLPAWLRAVGFSEKSDALLASFGGGEVLCLDLGTRRPRFWQRLFSRTYALEAIPNAVVIACGDGTVRFLDIANGSVLRTIEGHDGAVRCIAIRRGTLATSGDDKRLALWNINSGERLFVGVNQAQRIISIAIHSTSGMLVTGGKLGNFRIWDNNARLVRHDDLRCGSIRQVTFTPDGWGLAAACGDGRVRLWETREWTISRGFEDERKKPVVALAFDMHGQTLVTGSSNGTIRLWNVTTGQLQRVIEGFGESIQDLVMSPDNRYLAISFANGMLQIHKWPLDLRLGEKLFNE